VRAGEPPRNIPPFLTSAVLALAERLRCLRCGGTDAGRLCTDRVDEEVHVGTCAVVENTLPGIGRSIGRRGDPIGLIDIYLVAHRRSGQQTASCNDHPRRASRVRSLGHPSQGGALDGDVCQVDGAWEARSALCACRASGASGALRSGSASAAAQGSQRLLGDLCLRHGPIPDLSRPHAVPRQRDRRITRAAQCNKESNERNDERGARPPRETVVHDFSSEIYRNSPPLTLAAPIG